MKNWPKKNKSYNGAGYFTSAKFDPVNFLFADAKLVAVRRAPLSKDGVDARIMHALQTRVRTFLSSASFEPLEFADATFSRELLPGRPHSGGDRRARSQARKPPRESFSGRTAGLSTRQQLAEHGSRHPSNVIFATRQIHATDSP